MVRNKASGSIIKRYGSERTNCFSKPLIEFLKNDLLGDPLLNDEHLIEFNFANFEDLELMKKNKK